jgi:phenylacetate-CoA ligase
MFLLKGLIEVAKSKDNLQLSKEKLKDLQLTKFRKLVKHCYQNSIFYKEIIDEYKIDINNCIPEDFPIIDKQVVLNNFDRIVTNKEINFEKVMNFLNNSKDPIEEFIKDYFILRTSGSSGQIGIYAYHINELLPILTSVSRSYPPKFKQRMAFIGKVDNHYAGVTIAGVTKRLPWIYDGLLLIDINEPTEDIINKLNTFQPTNLSGYAYTIARLAEFQEKGILKIKPSVIQVGGEPLNISDKILTEKIFGTEVINVYGSTEMLTIGYGSKRNKGYIVLMDDYIYSEIFDRYTIMTNLFNYTLPLIRFKVDDKLEEVENELNIPFTTIKGIIGRTDMNPYFINEDGKEDFISGLIFHTIVLDGVSKFQLLVHDKLNCTMTVMFKEKLTKIKKNNLIKQMKEKMKVIFEEKKMKNVSYDIVEVDNIEPDPKTGKFKAVVIDQISNI